MQNQNLSSSVQFFGGHSPPPQKKLTGNGNIPLLTGQVPIPRAFTWQHGALIAFWAPCTVIKLLSPDLDFSVNEECALSIDEPAQSKVPCSWSVRRRFRTKALRADFRALGSSGSSRASAAEAKRLLRRLQWRNGGRLAQQPWDGGADPATPG